MSDIRESSGSRPTQYRTPDWLGIARSHAERTGLPERRVLEIIYEKVGRALIRATTDEQRVHLRADLVTVERAIRERPS